MTVLTLLPKAQQGQASDFAVVKASDIHPLAGQVRAGRLEPEALAELAASIAEQGVLEPLVVYAEGAKYRIICGHRRHAAAQLVGLDEVPCMVRKTPANELELRLLQLVENIQRADLSPIEEGSAYRELNERHGLTLEDIGQRIGKSKAHVSRAITIAKLPEDIKSVVTTSQQQGRGAIAFEHLLEVAKLADFAAQQQLLQRIIDFHPTVRELRAERSRPEPVSGGWASARFEDPEGKFWAVLHFRDQKRVDPSDIERAALKMVEDARRAQMRARQSRHDKLE